MPPCPSKESTWYLPPIVFPTQLCGIINSLEMKD
jgi:hypothetical protein